MVRYLLVDARDGKVLEELASPQEAARVLLRHARNPHGDPPVSVVRLDSERGSLSDIDSMVSMRLLPPLIRGSRDRPSRHPRSTQPSARRP